MPASEYTGAPIDPAPWNESDGFSPGSPILTLVPGLDLHQTWGTADEPHSSVGPNELGYFDYRDHLADVGRYAAPDAPIVLLDADTGERAPVLVRARPEQGGADLEDPVLILRPAVNLAEGHRYIVALRDLRDGAGRSSRRPTPSWPTATARADDARAHHMESIFGTLEDAGIERGDLYLAWDFTVASERNLTEKVLHIRDDAFAQLGDTDLADRRVQGSAPEFAVDTHQDLDPAVKARHGGSRARDGAELPRRGGWPDRLGVQRHRRRRAAGPERHARGRVHLPAARGRGRREGRRPPR